jgi:hypothetical protein
MAALGLKGFECGFESHRGHVRGGFRARRQWSSDINSTRKELIMDDGEIAAMLEQARADAERWAVPVEGAIRRTLVGGDDDALTCCVWDDDFFTTLRVPTRDPRPELVRDLFAARKRQCRDDA